MRVGTLERLILQSKFKHHSFKTAPHGHIHILSTPHSIRLFHHLLLLIAVIYRSHCHSLHSLETWPSAFSFIPTLTSFWGMTELCHFLYLTSNSFSLSHFMTHTHCHPIRTVLLKSTVRIYSLTQSYILSYKHPDCNISLTSLRTLNDPTTFALNFWDAFTFFITPFITHGPPLFLLPGTHQTYLSLLLLNSCGKSPTIYTLYANPWRI